MNGGVLSTKSRFATAMGYESRSENQRQWVEQGAAFHSKV